MVDSTQCSSSRGKTRLQKRGEEEEEMLNIFEKKIETNGGKKHYYAHKTVQIETSSNGALSCTDVIFIRA